MSAVTFDTLKLVRTLEAAGMLSTQAEAMADAVRESHDAADLATKGDLRELRGEMRADMRELRNELRSEMREMELRITIKLGALIVVGIGALAAIVKL
jgi:hypothetical protein